jgi:hypothetical protein
MAEIGAIEVALRAEIGQLQADLRKAEAATKTTSSKMTANFKSVSASLKRVKGNAVAAAAVITGLATGAMANLARQAIRTANDLGDIAQKLGISASALQEFQYAANQNGVAINALNMGLQRFGRRAAEAANGTGEAKDALKTLGVQLRDSNGNLRSTEALFSDALRAIAKVPNELERNALAFKLFDSEGVAIVNMAGNFEELRDRARELGIVIDDDVIARSDKLQDRLDELATITSTRLSPALTDLGGNALVTLYEGMAELAGYADRVYLAFKGLESLTLTQAERQMTNLNDELKDIVQYREKLSGLFGEQVAALVTDHQIADVQQRIGALSQRLADLQSRADVPSPTSGKPTTFDMKTDAQLRAEEAALKRKESARTQIHLKFLEEMGREEEAIRYQLELQIAAIDELTATEAEKEEMRVELRKTAQAQIDKINAQDVKDQTDNVDELKDAYAGLFDYMERGFSDAMATMLLDGEITFKQLAMSFAREFLQMGIGQLAGSAFAQIGKAATTLFYGPQPGDLGFMGPVATANGGARLGGRPLLVGERGPELFIPSTSGFVANNNALTKMAGGAVSPVNVTVINNTGQEATTSQKDGPGGSRDIEVMIGAAISKNISRGGDVDRAIRASYGVQRIGRHGL